MKETNCYSDTELIENIEKLMESENVTAELVKMVDELIYRYTAIAETEGGLT